MLSSFTPAFTKFSLLRGVGCQIVDGNTADDLPIHHLRPRTVFIVSAKSRFDIGDGDLLVECCKRGGHGGSGIAMNKHYIRFCFFVNIS